MKEFDTISDCLPYKLEDEDSDLSSEKTIIICANSVSLEDDSED